jgi:vacuolar iron transporter family protein
VAAAAGAGADASSFRFVASGALVPVLPDLFGMVGLPAVPVSSGLVGLALLAVAVAYGRELLCGATLG